MQFTDLINGYLSKGLAEQLKNADKQILSEAEEIRIRVGRPIYIRSKNVNTAVGLKGTDKPYIPTAEDICTSLAKMSNYSAYAFNDEIKRGYITLPGGYRVGICGSTVYNADEISTIKDISSLNIRISREITGCADNVLKYICKDGIFYNTLIVSPPSCGKTTLLRDVIRQISNSGRRIGLVDERSEIAGTYLGQAQNDVGTHTDILDGCRKTDGMYMLLRSMAPEIIAVDEIGSEKELEYIGYIVNSGVGLLCTVHAYGMEELNKKNGFADIIKNRLFERYVVLSSQPAVGTVSCIYDKELNGICF